MTVDKETWQTLLRSYDVSAPAVARLVAGLEASERAALRFCRLLETWRSGTPKPSTAGARRSALEAAASTAADALEPLDAALADFLSQLRPKDTEGRSWYGEPGAGELVDWGPVLSRAGLAVSSAPVAQAYLELAVFVRALAGLDASARYGTIPTSFELWAGLFDLRDNLAPTVNDLRGLTA